MGSLISLINKLVGLLIPFIAYLKGKNDAKKEASEAQAHQEVLSIKRVLELERNVKELSDSQLDNIIRGRIPNTPPGGNDKPT